jgi:hypothetical protein
VRCYCCDTEVSVGRKVKLRPALELDEPPSSLDDPAYQFYCKEMTFRWAVVCQPCYRTLDNDCGVGEIGGRLFGLAGASRGDKARVINEDAYRAWQRKLAEQMGTDTGD